MGKVRYLVAQAAGKDGMPRYYWQPSTTLRAAGFRAQRVPPDWSAYHDPSALLAAAEARADELNKDVDLRRPPEEPIEIAPARRSRSELIQLAKRKRGDPDIGGRPYLYVIGTQKGLQKVGISTHPEQRLRDLEAASGRHLHIWLLVGGRASYARRLEAMVHKLLARHRQAGEWFAVLPHVALSAVTTAMATSFAQKLPREPSDLSSDSDSELATGGET